MYISNTLNTEILQRILRKYNYKFISKIIQLKIITLI